MPGLANTASQTALRQVAVATSMRPNKALSVASGLNSSIYNNYFLATTQLAMLAGLVGAVASAVGGDKNVAGRTLGKVSHTAEIPAQFLAEHTVEQARNKFSSLAESAGAAFSRITGSNQHIASLAAKTKDIGSSIADTAAPHLNDISARVSNVAETRLGSERTNKIRNMAGDLPGRISGANLGDTIYKSTLYGGLALNTAHSLFGLRNSLRAAKEMHKDLTGKNVTTFGIIFGRVPESMKSVRGNLLKQHLMPTSIQTMSMALMPKIAQMGGKAKIAAIMASQFMPTLYQMFEVRHDVLNTYNTVSQMQKLGQPVPPEAYAALFISADPTLDERGVKTTAALKQLAIESAEKQVPATDIINMMQKDANGGSRFLLALQNAAAIAATATTTNPDIIEAAPSRGEPVGPHTADLVSRRNQEATFKRI